MPTILTEKQVEGNRMLGSKLRHVLLAGGSRSGKTFVLCRAIVIRAIRAPGSTHVIFRYRFNHLKESIINGTMPKVMELCFPEVSYSIDKTDWFMRLPNDSRVLFGGLDDKERTEKILGQEHATIYLNECSQITYDARNKAMTRLAQKALMTKAHPSEPDQFLPLKAYYDENPPTVGHWTYRMFVKKLEPKSGELLSRPENYGWLLMNPMHNMANLPEEYIQELEALPMKDRLRFLEGKFLAETEGALWTMDMLDQGRRTLEQIPTMQRVTVNVDPSGAAGKADYRSDEIGITVTGCDHVGNGYLLADYSGRYSPDEWARVAVRAYKTWGADRIVAEKNFGGAMVESTIRTADKHAPIKLVSASRGKYQRAEPVAALYEQNKIFHVGGFPELEEQLCNFSQAGYQGGSSPDRADSAIWGFTELFIGGSSYTLANVA
jgi:phage terminase large subunit-like protein